MEWNAGDLVWFDPGVGHWLPGKVLECHKSAQVLNVQAVINGKPKDFTLSYGEGNIRPRQDLGQNGVEDMILLSDLEEAALLWNLKLRYDRNLIYTYIGSILVAVNPYRMFSESYGIDVAQKYKGKMLGELPPHLFALASSAYSALPESQIVIVSGESGSGKTESTKLVLQYLATVATRCMDRHATIREQMLEASPLLEAFGNAKTIRNDNSSRFGKYLEMHFVDGCIRNARVTQYLLEKSRIVTHATGERNYHVFYEMLSGLSKSEKAKFGLVEAEKYFYLNQGGGDCTSCHAGSALEWSALVRAMEVLGFEEGEQAGIVKVLSSVLHLGNVYFHRKQLRHGQEGVEIGSDAEIKWVAHLLQISPESIQRALTQRITETRSECMLSSLNIDQALDTRDAFAKTLYSALFNWLVSRINAIMHRGKVFDAPRICILDIFGFENFGENSFEQLCINYASESMQLFFNKYVFKFEQEEYLKEKLEWNSILWLDNTPVVHLMGKKPVGILHLLDDECNFPKASDTSFLEKCHYNHALNEHYSRPRIGSREFGIKHFAELVCYTVDGFLDKNRDYLGAEVLDMLVSSKDNFVCAIAKPLINQLLNKSVPKSYNNRFVTIKPRTPTLAARFCDNLHNLLESMSKCHPWFVRCLKPNNTKAPMKFDMPVVLNQLRYTGIADIIRMRKYGYPVRLGFLEFIQRFRCLIVNGRPHGASFRELATSIIETLPQNSSAADGLEYQLGATRIFIRELLWRRLEVRRCECLREAATIIQKNYRRHLAVSRYRHIIRCAIIIQKFWRAKMQHRRYQKLQHGITQLQAIVRGRIERKRFQKLKLELKARRKEEQLRIERERRELKELQIQKAAQMRAPIKLLELPTDLKTLLYDIQLHPLRHTDKNLVKVTNRHVNSNNLQRQNVTMPFDLERFDFRKYISIYLKTTELAMRKEPISAPFLGKAAARDEDCLDAITIFNLILLWENDLKMSWMKEKTISDYVIYKGLNSRALRDEILIQLCNQTCKNGQADRIWQLMANCLSCFQPSPSLSKYLYSFIKDNSGKHITSLTQKLASGMQKGTYTRLLPLSLLEWNCAKQNLRAALPVTLPNGKTIMVDVDSWTSCEETARIALNALNLESQGWTVVLDDSGMISESAGCNYIMDLIADMEFHPFFSVTSPLLKFGMERSQTPHQEHSYISSPSRPKVPPPEPPIQRKSSSGQSKTSSFEYKHSTPNGNPASRERKTSRDALSRMSALNERYFENDKSRSRSLDDLISEPQTDAFNNLGLSRSPLNDRYHSVEQLSASIQPVISDKSYRPKEDDFDYMTANNITRSHQGTGEPSMPRFIKSQNVGKKAPPGSHSSRAQIEKSESGFRSSALSDTSESPSLASHVRRVRVPSQASDVDQFLDELFSPVLDGNMDDLSDARSLAASLKERCQSVYADETTNSEIIFKNTDQSMSNADVLRIRGGGGGGGGGTSRHRSRTTSRESSVLDREVENITKPSPRNENMDDYISNLFQPIFNDARSLRTNESRQDMSQHSDERYAPSGPSSFSFPSMPLGNYSDKHRTDTPDNYKSPFSDTPRSNATSSSMPSLEFDDRARVPLHSPADDEAAAYQQHLERTFLESAMAQNIQIQQKLLAQNQALQKLLSKSLAEAGLDNNPTMSQATGNSTESAFSKMDASALRNSVSPLNRTSSSSFAFVSKNGVPPPPPPMPPPLECNDPEIRPFMDPYGRAKTVRIGKWRWPPPKDNNTSESEENFMHFKIRQSQRQSNYSNANNDGNTNLRDDDWDEHSFEPVLAKSPSTRTGTKRSFEIGAERPSPGSVGKLKLSSEMRQRLEKVTLTHSLRSSKSTDDKHGRVINKLEDGRKLALQQQLAGRWANDGASTISASERSSPVDHKIIRTSPSQQSWSESAWKPDPPPPPIGPPAALGPPSAATATSYNGHTNGAFAVQRHDNDASFGMHQKKLSSDESTSYRGNWDMHNSAPRNNEPQWDHVDNSNTSRDRVDSPVISPNHLRNRFSNSTAGTPPTFRTHQYNKSIVGKEKQEFINGGALESSKQDMFAHMPSLESPPLITKENASHFKRNKSPLTNNNDALTYHNVSWLLRVRKEVYRPGEPIGTQRSLPLIFCQVVADVFGITPCIRINNDERRNAINQLSEFNITVDNCMSENHPANQKLKIVDMASKWPLYFARFFSIVPSAQISDINLLAVSHKGVYFVQREKNQLKITREFRLHDIKACIASRPTLVTLNTVKNAYTLQSPRAQQMSEMITKYVSEHRKIRAKSQQFNSVTPIPANRNHVINNYNGHDNQRQTSPYMGNEFEIISHMNGDHASKAVPIQGKYSLAQFAINNFRLGYNFDILKMDSMSMKGNDRDWVWEEHTNLITWQHDSLSQPLLKIDNSLAPLALECFDCILQYCGDMAVKVEMSEVKCVYTVLMHCHKHPELRDEVYCQLIKQTTTNKSDCLESCQRAWRLLSIVAAYFSCSDALLPYLIEHLNAASAERRLKSYGTAMVCMANLRKTQRHGGRKNVPSIEEVTAVSAGRSARRQIYRLPGGAERVVNTHCSTVVADVIAELCTLIGVTSEAEQQEFSLYCIVQGDAFTMPLAAGEYILDVTTELHKTLQPFYLIFCRSVWCFPLKTENVGALYTEVLFNQVAPDYLEGLLLRLHSGSNTEVISPELIRDMATIAALLHRVADFNHLPSLKEVKFLLPKTVLGLREPRPPQWLSMVHASWSQVAHLAPSVSKLKVLQTLSHWPLFGSSFFAIKIVTPDPIEDWPEHILALNRYGVHLVEINTHDTLQHWPFSEVISTRKVRSDDGMLFLDIKCGNLLQQQVTRLQTEQAHEISRLVRQYITFEQANSKN